MNFKYQHPLVITSHPQPELKILSVKHGVTTVELSNGQIVRATLHIDSVKPSTAQPGALDLSFSVTSEVMTRPEFPIMDQHETAQ